ncbi:MAG: tRNA lysidine(34) synthetase TilS [Bacillota bacterium]|nr:tRNA lysidine(34) synthetase TilS [Bacillota bacterium]
MINQVRAFIQKHALIASGDTVIVAVSGGPDSIALLHVLTILAPELQCDLAVAHVNHLLRENANEDERFVRDCCEKWEIPFYTTHQDVASFAKTAKKSLEDAGRVKRYEFFRELAEKLEASCIATAHHHDDVAETVLLHLLRGTGIKGLRGIMPHNGQLVRPFLDVTRQEILNYLSQNQLAYRIDESNDCVAYTRNRIRHELIPYLEESFNPRIVETLCQLARISADENDLMEAWTDECWHEIVSAPEGETIHLNRSAFSALPVAIQRRLVMFAFSQLSENGGWTLSDAEKVLILSEKDGSSRVLHLKKKVKVNLSYDKIVFTRQLPERKGFKYRVPIPGQIKIEETGDTYEFRLIPREGFQPCPEEFYFDYNCLSQPLYLRSRKNGDVFCPFGMKGTKKVKDFFIDQKIPYFERERLALLVSAEDKVYAILGFRRGREALVSTNTDTILVIKKA